VASDEIAALDAGDVLWIYLGRPVGHGQGGRRPALVLTPREYNARSSVIVVCPITHTRRHWPFEVPFPAMGRLSGSVLVDQIKVIDPAARSIRYAGRLPDAVLGEVKAKLVALLAIPVSN
jgi:mRNA interferase MazF